MEGKHSSGTLQGCGEHCGVGQKQEGQGQTQEGKGVADGHEAWGIACRQNPLGAVGGGGGGDFLPLGTVLSQEWGQKTVTG